MTRKQYIKPEIRIEEVAAVSLMVISVKVEQYDDSIEDDSDDDGVYADPNLETLSKGSGDDWDSLW